MQKPTPVGSSGYAGGPAVAAAAAIASGSSGTGFASQKRGKEQISALLDQGVAVATRPDAAAWRSRSSQPSVVTVSELSSTTSSGAVSPKAALTLATKPRLAGRRR